jgi:hypothetical protein
VASQVNVFSVRPCPKIAVSIIQLAFNWA